MSAPIPAEVHKIKGTRPTRAANFDAQLPAGRPKLPKDLTPDARKIFKQLVAQLEARRTCTEGDRQVLHLFSVQYTRWIKARAKVDELGEVVTDIRLDSKGIAHEVLRKNPWVVIAQETEKQMHAILRDLGLTPSARRAVKPLGKAQDLPLDPFAAWAAGAGLPAAVVNDDAVKVGTPSKVSLDDIPTEVL